MKKLLIIVCLLCVGCEGEDYRKTVLENRQLAINACLNAGGIPIFSVWDTAVMIECKIPSGYKR